MLHAWLKRWTYKIKPYWVFRLSFSRTRQLSRDVLSDAGFLFHKVSVFREVIRNRLYGFVSVINYTIRRYIQKHLWKYVLSKLYSKKCYVFSYITRLIFGGFWTTWWQYYWRNSCTSLVLETWINNLLANDLSFSSTTINFPNFQL